MSRQPRQPHDPLRGTWRAGQAPEVDTPTPAPQQQQEDVDTTDYSLENVEYMLGLRATRIVRQMYGIAAGDFRRWGPQHDRAARAVLNKLMRGEELAAHWRSQRKEPPPIDPWSHLVPRQSSR